MPRYKNVDINVEELRNWLKNHNLETGETFGKVAENIGKSKCYWSSVMYQGHMPERLYKHFVDRYMLPPDAFIEKPKAPAHATSSAVAHAVGYTMGLVVKPDKVRVTINLNGEELYGSWARIKGDTECDLLQAISYASHYCYKMAEQKRFEDEMSV